MGQPPPANSTRRLRVQGVTYAVLFLASLTWLSGFHAGFNDLIYPGQPDPFLASTYSHLESHCSSVPPISQSEFISRQISLAKTLESLGASAYIAEPGAYSQFFGNFSKAQWSLSERPLLLIITPEVSTAADTGSNVITPQVTVLTPKFETTRAKLLPIPSLNGTIKYVEWAEDADPFSAILSFINSATHPQPNLATTSSRKIFVDNSIRKFIVDGLLHASDLQQSLQKSAHLQQSLQVFSAPPEITQMRERKSEAELAIMKCVNEATLLAIREVHKNLAPGIQESHARNMMATALRAAGLRDGGCLTLFGENAALPHGSGTDRVLSDSDFALFDCTASLHGYWSDVTRTVSLTANSRIPPSHLDTWNLVQKAQQAAISTAKNGTVTKAVDAAARNVFREEKLERYFTHRLGHGIGLEVHEAPYLRGGNDDVIQVGHTFSDEPGLYIEGDVGVRLEDCFYIDASGDAVYLTQGVGGPSESPWLP